MKEFFVAVWKLSFKPYHIVVACFVLVGFIFSGPFGTFGAMSIPERTIYWAPHIFIALIVGGFTYEVIHRLLPPASPIVRGFLCVCLFTAIYTPIDFAISQAALFGRPEHVIPFWNLLIIDFIWTSIVVAWIMISTQDRVSQAAVMRPRLYARLPEGTVSEIAHITVSDHYTVIFLGDRSEHRVLMRFADAEKEMDETPGFCIHRSHWVAAKQIQTAKRVGNREFVELSYGKEVPVSKTYRENLVAAGFF